MTSRASGARARVVPGRFAWVCAGVVLVMAGCTTVGGPPSGSAGRELAPVVVEPGPLDAAERAEAERLWASAQASFEARRFFEALRTMEQILDRFPSSPISGEALRLTALAEVEVDSLARADASAGRYLALVGEGDPRAAEMLFVQARAAVDEAERRLDRLLRIGGDAPDELLEAATPLTREAADELGIEPLSEAIAGVVDPGPLAAVAQARLAVALLEVARTDEASRWARSAIEGGATGTDLAWARGVLEGELPEGRRRTTTFSIAAVLPTGGPPALAEYAAQLQEGIEVAVATVLGPPFEVTAVAADDEGDPVTAATLVSNLEREGVVGMVGFLQDEVLSAAAAARSEAVLLVSPTARNASVAGTAVYSLEGADVEGARAVARYGASRAFQRIAMLYPDNDVSQAEADAFEAEAAALGMSVVGRFTYTPGAAFFETQIVGARNALRRAELAALALTPDDTLHAASLEPAALFMPIPAEDVSFLAPQVLHFGLDTLAIEILGTSGWTDPQTLRGMDARLTNGVIATAAVEAGPDDEGPRRFREAYEERYQRSLVGTTAALGYDAALLLLEALRPGRVLPDQLRASFEGLTEIRGATGLFSVVDGRVARRTRVVRIQDRTPVPLEIR